MTKKIKGGILTVIGYILSPLSWWNDMVVNIPIAYFIAFLFGLISKSLFFPALVIAYWLTNIVGLILVHRGVNDILINKNKKYTKKNLIKDLIFSFIYTFLIVFLIKSGILKFPLDYFK